MRRQPVVLGKTLSLQEPEACSISGDENGDGVIMIDEPVTAVDRALEGRWQRVRHKRTIARDARGAGSLPRNYAENVAADVVLPTPGGSSIVRRADKDQPRGASKRPKKSSFCFGTALYQRSEGGIWYCNVMAIGPFVRPIRPAKPVTPDRDGVIAINELGAAVNAALRGCASAVGDLELASAAG